MTSQLSMYTRLPVAVAAFQTLQLTWLGATVALSVFAATSTQSTLRTLLAWSFSTVLLAGLSVHKWLSYDRSRTSSGVARRSQFMITAVLVGVACGELTVGAPGAAVLRKASAEYVATLNEFFTDDDGERCADADRQCWSETVRSSKDPRRLARAASQLPGQTDKLAALDRAEEQVKVLHRRLNGIEAAWPTGCSMSLACAGSRDFWQTSDPTDVATKFMGVITKLRSQVVAAQ